MKGQFDVWFLVVKSIIWCCLFDLGCEWDVCLLMSTSEGWFSHSKGLFILPLSDFGTCEAKSHRPYMTLLDMKRISGHLALATREASLDLGSLAESLSFLLMKPRKKTWRSKKNAGKLMVLESRFIFFLKQYLGRLEKTFHRKTSSGPLGTTWQHVLQRFSTIIIMHILYSRFHPGMFIPTKHTS